MASTTTLADLMARIGDDSADLIDAPTGVVIGDSPVDYEVLAVTMIGGYLFAAVVGPSSQIDVYGPHPGTLNRDALADVSGLAAWVGTNYPVVAEVR